MFPPMIGSIYNSLKTTELNMKWQQRKKDPNWDSMDQRSKEIARLQETAADVRKSNLTSAIDGKLQAGGELSPQELEYLKQTNPQLYQEAIKIAQERRAYEKELENCETKDEVEQKKTAKMQQMLMQAKAIASNANIPEGEKYNQLMKISRRTMGICNEHNKFVQTLQYASLPREYELEEARKREKEKAGDSQEPTENPDLYLNDAEMQKQLDALAAESFKGDSKETGDPSAEQAQPEPDAPKKEGGPEVRAAGERTAKAAPSPVGAGIYDARGSVKTISSPAKARLDVKR